MKPKTMLSKVKRHRQISRRKKYHKQPLNERVNLKGLELSRVGGGGLRPQSNSYHYQLNVQAVDKQITVKKSKIEELVDHADLSMIHVHEGELTVVSSLLPPRSSWLPGMLLMLRSSW